MCSMLTPPLQREIKLMVVVVVCPFFLNGQDKNILIMGLGTTTIRNSDPFGNSDQIIDEDGHFWK